MTRVTGDYGRTMDVSLCLDPGRPWADFLQIARAAEDAGVHTLYVPDHFLPHENDGGVSDGPMLECWTLLSALAGHSRRARLGTLVLGGTYRHPAVVANMAAALDHASEGRVVLGLGAGWQANEHRAYGIELPPVGPRLDRFEESTRVVHSLLRRPRTTITGTYYSLVDAPCRPAPLQDPLPILIGGGGERRTMRIAAEYADLWHAWSTPDAFPAKNAVLDRHCAEVGRDPGAIRRVTGAFFEDPAGAAEGVAAFEGCGADEFVLIDHRERPPGTTVDMVVQTAP